MSRATFGPAAGSPNWAQGGVPYGGYRGRFAGQNRLWLAMRAFLRGDPMQEYLPTWAPFAWAWTRGWGSEHPYAEDLQPEAAIAAGSGEDAGRNIWGDYYYGYHADLHRGEPWREDASYVDAAYGASPYHALHDPSAQFWPYSVPDDAFPEEQRLNLWDLHSHSGGSARVSQYGGIWYR